MNRVFGSCLFKDTGTSHKQHNRPCEDNCYRTGGKHGVHVVTVSDGAGSCEHALQGSTIASTEAGKLIAENFDTIWELQEKEAAAYIIDHVVAKMDIAAKQNKWTLDSMYATLICAAKHPDDRFILFHVGDGYIVGYDTKNGCEVLSQYTHTHALNETTFVNYPGTEYHLIRGKKPYASFLLGSDGSEPFLIVSGYASEPIWLMNQASFVLSENELSSYISVVNQYLREECHAYDDISFAILTDFRYIEDVFEKIDPVFLSDLLNKDVAAFQSKKKLKRYALILRGLHSVPDGIRLEQLCRIAHAHKVSRLRRYLDTMFAENQLEYHNNCVCLR